MGKDFFSIDKIPWVIECRQPETRSNPAGLSPVKSKE
jgi:hypothetical protein